MIYENVLWDGNIKKNVGRYTNCKHFIAIDMILKHSLTGSRLGRVIYIIYSPFTMRQEIRNIHIFIGIC